MCFCYKSQKNNKCISLCKAKEIYPFVKAHVAPFTSYACGFERGAGPGCVLQRDNSRNLFNAMLRCQLSFEIRISEWERGHGRPSHGKQGGPGYDHTAATHTAAT